MRRSEKAEIIISKLEELYPETPIPLDHSNPFELLVSVLMSAQTTDLKVNEVTPALFSKANNPRDMAKLDVEVILNDIDKLDWPLQNLRISYAYRNFLSKDMMVKSLVVSRNWKTYPV